MKDEIKEILESLDKIAKSKYYPEDLLTYKECQLLLDYITTLQDTLKDREEYCYGLETQLTNLQEKIDHYENPDDMTLMFMWCDEKAKDKIKQLQEERKTLYRYTSEKGFELVGDDNE